MAALASFAALLDVVRMDGVAEGKRRIEASYEEAKTLPHLDPNRTKDWSETAKAFVKPWTYEDWLRNHPEQEPIEFRKDKEGATYFDECVKLACTPRQRLEVEYAYETALAYGFNRRLEEMKALLPALARDAHRPIR